jgi:hypothetical protein
MSITDSEVDHQLTALHIRAGSPPDLRQRDRALAWLLHNADRSFPVVLARATAEWSDLVLLDLLGRYRRAESTAVLLRAFSDEHARLQAASGLGLSPDPAARAALRAALASADSGRAAAALSGMGASGDPSYCADIAPQLHAENAEVRWMAVEAGSRLACLDNATLESISHSDGDAAVRALAADKLKSR